jgi:hypothetical protein
LFVHKKRNRRYQLGPTRLSVEIPRRSGARQVVPYFLYQP